MPRVSIRKLFVYFLAVASCILLALNIQQRATGLFTSSLTPSGPTGPSGSVSALTGLRTVVEETPPTPTRHALDGSVLDPGDRSIPDISHRPWYMKDGEIRPTQSKVSEETGERLGMITKLYFVHKKLSNTNCITKNVNYNLVHCKLALPKKL